MSWLSFSTITKYTLKGQNKQSHDTVLQYLIQSEISIWKKIHLQLEMIEFQMKHFTSSRTWTWGIYMIFNFLSARRKTFLMHVYDEIEMIHNFDEIDLNDIPDISDINKTQNIQLQTEMCLLVCLNKFGIISQNPRCPKDHWNQLHQKFTSISSHMCVNMRCFMDDKKFIYLQFPHVNSWKLVLA